MIPNDILEYASLMGFDELEEVKLRGGEIVYLIQQEGAVGLPMYLHVVDGIVKLSTYEESMELFSEPDYMREG